MNPNITPPGHLRQRPPSHNLRAERLSAGACDEETELLGRRLLPLRYANAALITDCPALTACLSNAGCAVPEAPYSHSPPHPKPPHDRKPTFPPSPLPPPPPLPWFPPPRLFVPKSSPPRPAHPPPTLSSATRAHASPQISSSWSTSRSAGNATNASQTAHGQQAISIEQSFLKKIDGMAPGVIALVASVASFCVCAVVVLLLRDLLKYRRLQVVLVALLPFV